MKQNIIALLVFVCVPLLLIACSSSNTTYPDNELVSAVPYSPDYISNILNNSTSNSEITSTLKDCPTTDANILDSGYCGFNSEWTLYEDGLLCIYGNGSTGYISNSDEVPWYAYRDTIKNVYIADGITDLCHFAFKECYQLETARLPDTMRTIYLSAFESCTNLKEITLPEGLEDIHFWAFAYCDSLTEITIPGSIKHLDNYTFQGCSNVKNIVISDGVEKIGFDVFENSISLESVTLPKSIASIDVYTFRNCTNLKNVYYAGSEQDWNKINIKTDGNEDLINAQIHFEY